MLLLALSVSRRREYLCPKPAAAAGFQLTWSHVLAVLTAPAETVQLVAVVLYFFWTSAGTDLNSADVVFTVTYDDVPPSAPDPYLSNVFASVLYRWGSASLASKSYHDSITLAALIVVTWAVLVSLPLAMFSAADAEVDDGTDSTETRGGTHSHSGGDSGIAYGGRNSQSQFRSEATSTTSPAASNVNANANANANPTRENKFLSAHRATARVAKISALKSSPLYELANVFISRVITVWLMSTLMRPSSCIVLSENMDSVLSTSVYITCGGVVGAVPASGSGRGRGRAAVGDWASVGALCLLSYYMITASVLHADEVELLTMAMEREGGNGYGQTSHMTGRSHCTPFTILSDEFCCVLICCVVLHCNAMVTW